jgi:hypothetical protein
MNDKIHKFARKYQAVCRPSGQYWQRVQPVPIKIGPDPVDVMYQEFPCQSVPMVEIQLPEDRFRALVEHDDFLDKYKHIDHNPRSTFIDHAMAIVAQHEAECRIRNQHAAVQAAYQQYQTLLNLCR